MTGDTATQPQEKKTKARRERGSGSIFRQPGTTRWSIQYYVNGRKRVESTGSDDRQVAQQKLTQKLAARDRGEPMLPVRRKPLLVSELYDGLEKAYIRNHNRTLKSLKHRWSCHLESFFGDLKSAAVNKDLIESYRDSRLAEGAAQASVNREVAALKAMFRLAAEKLPKLPAFPTQLPEEKRTGFIEDEEFSAMVANASELWLRTFLEISYTVGWRKGEILNLRVRNINLRQRIIRLESVETKNGHGRECPMTDKIYQLLKECIAGKGREDFVLTRGQNHPVRDFRKRWSKLAERIGRPDLLVHDFRRSAARNLRRAGCSENTIMSIGGWETSSVFKRYDINDNKDKEIALAALEHKRIADKAKLEAEQADFSHNFSHNSDVTDEKQPAVGREIVQ